jgi:drug/metabolite transporter (DMT)-like permease
VSTAELRTPSLHQPNRAPKRWQADLALAAVALVWGSTFVVVKGALTHLSTMYFLTLRFAFASACMAPLVIPVFRRSGAAAVKRGLLCGLVAGVFLWTGYLLQTFGLKYTSAGNSGFLTGLYIVLVPLISATIYRRWPRSRELAGVGMAAAGIALLTIPNIGRNFRMNAGDLLTIGCAVAFAFHLLVLGYFSKRESVEALALGQVACTAVLSACSLVLEPPRAVWSASALSAILITGLFATALAFVLQTWGQRYTTPTRTALLFALEPVFALITAVLLGGEHFTVYSIGGGLSILSGILLVELKPARPSLHPKS